MALKRQSTVGFLEYAFVVFAFLLISDALTPLLYLSSGGGHGGVEVSESNPFRLFVAMGVYSVSLLLLAPRLRLASELLIRRPEIVLIALWCLFSILWSSAPGPVFRRAMADTLTICFCVYVATRYTLEEFLERLMVAFFIGGCVSVLLCLIIPSMAVHSGANAGAWYGAYGHKAILGRACALAIFTSLFLQPRTRPLRQLRVATICVFALLAVMSQSRASWLMIIWGLGAAGILQLLRTRRIEARLKTGILIMGVTAVVAIGVSTFAVLLQVFGRGLDFSGRGKMWEVAIMLAQRDNTWIGVGYRNFWLGDSAKDMLPYFSDWSRIPGHGHNGYVDAWLELGWIGLALLAAFILRGFPSLIRALVREPQRAAWAALTLFFLLFIINNMSASVALRHTDILWSASLIGTLFAARQALEEKRLAEHLRAQIKIRRARRKALPVGGWNDAPAGPKL